LKRGPKALSEQSGLKYHARSFLFVLNEDAMWEIIRAGGGFMWPIILCSIAAVAIILERLWTLQSNRVIPRDLAQKVWNWIEADQLSDKLVLALEQNSPLGKLLAIGIANRNKPRALMVERLEDGGRHVIHDLERFLNTLARSRQSRPCSDCWERLPASFMPSMRSRPADWRPENPIGRDRRSSHHHSRGVDRGDPISHCLSFLAGQG